MERSSLKKPGGTRSNPGLKARLGSSSQITQQADMENRATPLSSSAQFLEEPEKEPLVIDISGYDEETLEIVAPVIALAKDILWHWKTFPIVLPPPIETKLEPAAGSSATLRKKAISRTDLFIEPNFDEMRSIAFTSTGERKKLTKDQLESVRRSGEFEVESREFPGQKHRWILNQLLLKGTEKAHETLLDDLARAIHLIVVTASGRIFSPYFSLHSGLRSLSTAVRNLVDLLIGLPLVHNPHYEKKIHMERSRYLVAELKCNRREHLDTLCAFIRATVDTFGSDKDSATAQGIGRGESMFSRLVWEGCRIEECWRRPLLPPPSSQSQQWPQQGSSSLPTVPYQFVTPKGLEIDLRLCNQDVMSSAKPYLLQILNSALQGWIHEMRKDIVTELRSKNVPATEIRLVSQKRIAAEYLDRVCRLIRCDPNLAGVGGEGLAELFVAQVRTSMLVRRIAEEELAKTQKNREAAKADLGRHHPILSRVKPWMREKLDQAEERYGAEHTWEPHARAIEACKDLGLQQSAYFISRDLSFRRDQEPALRKELKHLREPLKTFTFSTRTWMPRNWVVEERDLERATTSAINSEHNHSRQGVWKVVPTVLEDQDDGFGNKDCSSSKVVVQVYSFKPSATAELPKVSSSSSPPSSASPPPSSSSLTSQSRSKSGKEYRVVKHQWTETNSRWPFWRWSNFYHRTKAWFWNFLYLTLVVIPICSPVSFTALFRRDPFCFDYKVCQVSGKLARSRSESDQVPSVISRVRALWRHVREARAAFEGSPDTGLFSKSVTRCLHIFVNYVLKGALGTAFLSLVLPPLIVACSFVSLLLALTSPVTVWGCSAVLHVLGCLFYDFEVGAPLNALLWNLAINGVLLGLIQPVLAGIVAFVLCPLGSLVLAVSGVLRKGCRNSWDAIVYLALVKKRAFVPVGDGFLARRISGPGLASNYYFKIRTEQALVVLETRMEMDQLSSYQMEVERQIRRPQQDFSSFVHRIFGPFGLSISDPEATGKNSGPSGGMLSLAGPSSGVKRSSSFRDGGVTNSVKRSHQLHSNQQPKPYTQLDSESHALISKLTETVCSRREQLENRLPRDNITAKIRLSESDLKVVLAEGTRMVRSFYPQAVLARMTDREVQSFWTGHGLDEGDWLGLASCLLAETLSPDFLVPLQDLDTHFALKVRHWSLNRYLSMALESSKWQDDLDFGRVIQMPKMGPFIDQPEIPIESFNPMSYSFNEGPATYQETLLRWMRRLGHRRGRSEVGMDGGCGGGHSLVSLIRSANPLPLPHPLDICVIIHNRDLANNYPLIDMESQLYEAIRRHWIEMPLSSVEHEKPSNSAQNDSSSLADTESETTPVSLRLLATEKTSGQALTTFDKLGHIGGTVQDSPQRVVVNGARSVSGAIASSPYRGDRGELDEEDSSAMCREVMAPDVDPEMASLRQSLEELDRDVANIQESIKACEKTLEMQQEQQVSVSMSKDGPDEDKVDDDRCKVDLEAGRGSSSCLNNKAAKIKAIKERDLRDAQVISDAVFSTLSRGPHQIYGSSGSCFAHQSPRRQPKLSLQHLHHPHHALLKQQSAGSPPPSRSRIASNPALSDDGPQGLVGVGPFKDYCLYPEATVDENSRLLSPSVGGLQGQDSVADLHCGHLTRRQGHGLPYKRSLSSGGGYGVGPTSFSTGSSGTSGLCLGGHLDHHEAPLEGHGNIKGVSAASSESFGTVV